jgi:hypothetical protein
MTTLHVGKLATRDLAGVDQAGGGDDRGAVLVVVEDRDVEFRAQLALDDEALGGLDVFKVDAAPRGADGAHAVDEFLRVLLVDLDVDGIDVSEAFEQDGLAFHDRLGRHWAKIAEAEDGRAVGDDGHHVALGGVVVGQLLVLRDGEHGDGDARRIGQRQVLLRGHRLGWRYRQLPRLRIAVEGEGFLVGEAGAFGCHIGFRLRANAQVTRQKPRRKTGPARLAGIQR